MVRLAVILGAYLWFDRVCLLFEQHDSLLLATVWERRERFVSERYAMIP